MLIVTEPVSPAGAELPPETPPVKASPAQPLAAKPQPAPAFTALAPPKMPGSSTDADCVPSKSMPKPKLHKVQPCGYTDARYPAGAAPRSDAEAVAMEQAARLVAAQRAARLAAAQAPAGNKPFTSDGVDAYIRGQQSMAGVGQMPNPWAHPAVHGAGKGKGKSKPADPFLGMIAEGPPKGKGKEGKGKEGKGQAKRDPREPLPCSRCGSFFVCSSVAATKGEEAHCSNPKCERSLELAKLTPHQQSLQLAANLAAKNAAAASAAVLAHEAAAAADAAATAAPPPVGPAAGAGAWAAGAPVVVDDTQLSPLTPADAAAAAGHSDTDVSSPDGQPTGPAAWARIGAYNKAKGPPTEDPSPANLAFMRGRFPQGPPAAGAAAETIDLLSQTSAGAAESPNPTPADAAGPGDASTAGADELAAALSSMWLGNHTQTEMLHWAVQELITR